MKTLISVIRRYPVTASVVCSFLTACLSAMVVTDAIAYYVVASPPDLISYVLFAGMMLIVCAGVFWINKKLMALTLMITMVLGVEPIKSQEPLPLVIIGGVVILGLGGIIGCRAYRKCERISKTKTNSWPEEMQFQAAASPGEYGANFSWVEEGFCYAERATPIVPVATEIRIVVHSTSNATVTVTAKAGHQHVQSWTEFMEELEGHGLPSVNGESSSWARNRHPVPAENVPITFDFETRTATIGAGGVLVTVERSADLRQWAPLLKVNVEEGSDPLSVEDATDIGAQFYRVTLTASHEGAQ